MYRYTESGLNNVWLANGYTVVRTPYGKGVQIENVAGLNRSIAMRLVKDKPYLTGAEFRFIRKELDMSQAALAKIIGKDAQSVARWEKGHVPKFADRMIRFVYCGFTSGNKHIKTLVERLNELDQQDHERMKFEKSGNNWKSLAA